MPNFKILFGNTQFGDFKTSHNHFTLDPMGWVGNDRNFRKDKSRSNVLECFTKTKISLKLGTPHYFGQSKVRPVLNVRQTLYTVNEPICLETFVAQVHERSRRVYGFSLTVSLVIAPGLVPTECLNTW